MRSELISSMSFRPPLPGEGEECMNHDNTRDGDGEWRRERLPRSSAQRLLSDRRAGSRSTARLASGLLAPAAHSAHRNKPVFRLFLDKNESEKTGLSIFNTGVRTCCLVYFCMRSKGAPCIRWW